MSTHIDRQTVHTVRTLMRLRHISVEKLAKAIGLSKSTLYEYLSENAPRAFDLRQLEAIAEALNVPTPLLIADRGDVLRWLADNPEFGEGPGGIPLWREWSSEPMLVGAQ